MTSTDNSKYGWGSFKHYYGEIANDNFSGWIVSLLGIFLLTLRTLDIFNIFRWTYFSFFVTANHKKTSDDIIDGTVLLKLFLAMSIFYFSWYESTLGFYLALLMAITTFASIPEAILFQNSRPDPSSYVRATVLGVLNYLELVFHFASFYAYTKCLRLTEPRVIGDSLEALEKIDYLYFSFITVSTIGFGHLKIIDSIGYKLVICQAFIFLLFVLVFFNLNVSRISGRNQ